KNVTTIEGTSSAASAIKASFSKLSNKAQWIELLCVRIGWLLLTMVILSKLLPQSVPSSHNSISHRIGLV
ncbi:hypothetical protein RYX36_004121, partial [Vicia faba]